MRKITVLAATAVCAAASAPSAFALRYASPAGTAANNCQTVATACDLTTAVHGVVGNMPSSDEEIVVEPGNYALTSEISPGASGLVVHGADGQPRPVIQATGTTAFHGVNLNLRRLEIDSDGNALLLSGGTLDQLIVRGIGTTGFPVCQCYFGVLRDSVVVALPGSTGAAAGTYTNGGTATNTYRNDTFYSAAAGAAALGVDQAQATGSVTVNATNVVAVNGAGGTDVAASTAGGPVTINLDHSAYASPSATGGAQIVDGGGHVTAAPAFANAASYDFHELAGSPTIDAGLDDVQNGTADLDGNARTVGARTDIGAFEYVPPPPTTVSQPPANTAAPSIAGTRAVGQTLTASPGSWTGTAPIAYAYQWQRCDPTCTSIVGATAATYKLGDADAGRQVRVVVTAANGAGRQSAVSGLAAVSPTDADIKAVLGKELTPHGKSARIRKLVARRKYRLQFRALIAGNATVRWYRGRTLLATGKARFAAAGSKTITVRLTTKGRRLLGHSRTLKLTANGSFARTGRPTITARKSFRLRR